jgi:hypothetical protein
MTDARLIRLHLIRRALDRALAAAAAVEAKYREVGVDVLPDPDQGAFEEFEIDVFVYPVPPVSDAPVEGRYCKISACQSAGGMRRQIERTAREVIDDLVAPAAATP